MTVFFGEHWGAPILEYAQSAPTPLGVACYLCRPIHRGDQGFIRPLITAIPGGTVCRWHGGAAGQVKAKAAIRAEILPSGLGDSHVDPGEVLLQLVTQSAARAKRYASELEALVDEEGLAAAMVGEIEIPTKHGGYKAGEYIRGLAQLEAQERDRCANFATKAVAGGLAERQVRLAE
jgi:hypothetical protein